MQFSRLHYPPLAPLFFAVLIGIFFLVLLLIQLGILRYAYMRLGVSSTGAFMLLAASLLGSYFNIPVWHLPAETVSAAREIDFFGVRYLVPTVVQWPGTIIAVNVGGAVIPTLMSIYLLVRNMVWIEGAIATAIVTAVTHWLAEPVPGVGIAEPICSGSSHSHCVGAVVICKGCA